MALNITLLQSKLTLSEEVGQIVCNHLTIQKLLAKCNFLEYDPYITCGAKSKLLQITIGLFYWLVLLLCWVGNTFLLYGTIRYKAVKLDSMSVWLVQNLAVADLGHGLFHVLPAVITASFGWVCLTFFLLRFYFI